MKEKKHSKPDENFIRVLSHQLKSPISTIESLLEVVANGFTGKVDSKTIHFVKKAISRASEARAMVNDIINYEMYSDAGKKNASEIDIIFLLDSIIKKLITAASDKDISLTVQYPENIKIMVQGDHAGLELALRNLIENAIKYTGPNGTITATLSYTKKPLICRISIVDTGFGISKGELDAIFEPFFRSLKHKTTIPGSGLGLSIVKRIITGHKGNITVKSKVHEGSSFIITLPYRAVRVSGKGLPKNKRVLIIGGVTAGPKAAARLRRIDENLDIAIIEKGEFLSYTGSGLPSYISGKVNSPKELMSTADHTVRDVYFFESIKNIKVYKKTEALEIDRKTRRVKCRDLINNKIKYIPYEKLILATGAMPVIPQIKGIKQKGIYSLYRIEDAETIKNALSGNHAHDVFVIGGGLVGVETAESLMQAGARVTILEKDDYILTQFDEDISKKIQQELSQKGIKIVTGVKIKEVINKEGLYSIITENKHYTADIVLLSAGVKPNAKLAAKAGLKIGRFGGVMVNEYLQTSDKTIYAIGDCAESLNIITKKHVYWPLGSVSTKMGRIAADSICGRKVKFSGSIGTTMFKIFDIFVARTGLSLKNVMGNGYEGESIIVTGLDKAHYYDDAGYIVLKVIADKKSQIILGAQGYGKGDIIKSIEILACAIHNSMTLDEIFKIDLGYYPAFNNPIDIVQTACLMLKSKIEGFVKTISSADFIREKKKIEVIDVRPVSEYTYGSIEGSINIPLENLRMENIALDKKTKIVLYSQTSSRAYEAYRYLSTKGYLNIYMLEGGYIFYR